MHLALTCHTSVKRTSGMPYFSCLYFQLSTLVLKMPPIVQADNTPPVVEGARCYKKGEQREAQRAEIRSTKDNM